MQPNRKGSHETAHWLHCAVNHGTVQSIRADDRYFTNPASVDFSSCFQAFSPRKSLKIGTDVDFTVDGKANANKYYLSNYKRIKYYPDKISIYQSEGERFVALSSESEWIDWMDLCAIKGRK